VSDYEVLVDDSDDDVSWHAPLLLQRLVCYKQQLSMVMLW
jgi:hypothetical protein